MQQTTVRTTQFEYELSLIQKEIPAKVLICPFSEKKLMGAWVVMLQVQRKYLYYGKICIITSIIVKKKKKETGWRNYKYSIKDFHFITECTATNKNILYMKFQVNNASSFLSCDVTQFHRHIWTLRGLCNIKFRIKESTLKTKAAG
jgi:hypothetical protein